MPKKHHAWSFKETENQGVLMPFVKLKETESKAKKNVTSGHLQIVWSESNKKRIRVLKKKKVKWKLISKNIKHKFIQNHALLK